MSLTFLAVVMYCIIISLMGVYFSKYVKTTDDFTVAGRSLPFWVLSGTLIATCLGGGTVVGGANSLAYSNGFWVAIMWGIATPAGVLILYCIADRIRVMQFSTVPQIIEKRYGQTASIIATVIMVLSYLGIVAYQYKSVGYILNVTLGIPVNVGTVIGLALITVTALFGGLISVAYTDLFSAVLMVIGIGIGVPSALYMAGGWDVVCARLPEMHMSPIGKLSLMQCLGYFMATFFLVIGDQSYYQRFFAAKDHSAVKKGIIVWLLGVSTIIPLVAVGATIARALYPNIDAGEALMHLAEHGMPSVLGAITVATIAGFVITTGNSYLLSCGVNISWDIYSKLKKGNVDDKKRLAICRLAVIALALIAYILITFLPNVLRIQMYAYAMYGAALSPALLAAVLWEKATPKAGLASMLIGASIVLVWEFLGVPFGVSSIVVSAPCAIITLMIVGNITYNGELNPFKVNNQ